MNKVVSSDVEQIGKSFGGWVCTELKTATDSEYRFAIIGLENIAKIFGYRTAISNISVAYRIFQRVSIDSNQTCVIYFTLNLVLPSTSPENDSPNDVSYERE